MVALLLAALLLSAAVVGADAERAPGEAARTAETTTTTQAASSETTDVLPGTTLEAEERSDGTSPAPWLIGSGIAAVAAVAIGGTLLKRRMD